MKVLKNNERKLIQLSSLLSSTWKWVKKVGLFQKFLYVSNLPTGLQSIQGDLIFQFSKEVNKWLLFCWQNAI